MTNDEIWHQSTVMERCEILRSRLDDMESTVDHTARITQHCEILRSRLDSLWTMGPPTVPAFAAENAVVEEMARLKRIEAAAQDFINRADRWGARDYSELRRALRS